MELKKSIKRNNKEATYAKSCEKLGIMDGSDIDSQSPVKKPRLEGEALIELRKKLRERKNMLKLIPNFHLKPIGLNASLEVALDDRRRLGMRDLQNLLLYALLGTRAPVEPSK